MNKYVVKVIAKEVSTGFIHFPVNQQEAYVICSLHAIADKNTLALSDEITIDFFSYPKISYKVTSADVIIKGGSTQNEDVAVIIFPRVHVPDITERNLPQLIRLTGKELKCQVTGLPASTDNKFIRTLYDGKIIDDKDYARQIQIVVSDPLVQHPDADNLVDGYSGSPLLIHVDGGTYCFGVLTDYEESSKRVMGFTLELLSDLLVKAGQPPLVLDPIETDESILSDILRIDDNSARILGRARSTIGQQHLERGDVLKEIVGSIENKAVTLITGVAGVGKSAATKVALEGMRDRYEIIALQGEQLDKEKVDLIFTDLAIGVSNSFPVLLNSPRMKREKILLIDSLEKIYETLHADVITDFFSLLRSREDLKIVLTCRSYASQDLQFRYLREFPPVSIYRVPLLTDGEFKQIVENYPDLEKISSNESVQKILRVPFNLDKATLLGVERLKEINTEAAFRNLVWRYVIEDHDREPLPEMRVQRGLVLEEIAKERALRMTSFVTLDPRKNSVVSKLVAGSIIEPSNDPTRGYAIAHDIYEDWALLRVIGKAFSKSYPVNPIKDFFFRIGYSPSIRRSYKQWLSERLSAADTDIDNFILAVLRATDIKYWKDETLLAILQTSHFVSFTKKFQHVFFESQSEILKRCILLLNVACKTPDYELIERLPAEKRGGAYLNAYLVPHGEVWGTLLEFIAENIQLLTDEFEVILPVLTEWEKILRYYKPLPAESKYTGKIILAYFERYKRDLADEKYHRNRNQFPDMVSLLFKLTEIFRNEVAGLLKDALEFKRDDENYSLDSFHDEIIGKALTWLDSRQVSQYLPKTVIAAARREWLYFPPTAEELAALQERMPFFARGGGIHEHEENTFGVSSEMKRDTFPASSLQTPIYHLLCHHTQLATSFIIELFNHSVDAYWKSDFLTTKSEFMGVDPRVDITYTLGNGTTVSQHGSSVLWSMYRGGRVATPYLLQSVLQALEKYMLELADFIEKDQDNKHPNVRRVLFGMTEALLLHSRTVSTTAVVVSVGTAHYSLMADYLLPLLRVKEIYEWDWARSGHEAFVLNPVGSKATAQIIWEENKRSNELAHRKQTLRYVVMNLSLSSHRKQVESILDDFYKRDDPDENWRFMLNAMDYRKLKFVKEVENGIMVEPMIDDDLQKIADRNEPMQREIEIIQQANNWALVRMKDHDGLCSEDEFELWDRYFKIAFRSDIEHPQADLFNHPALLAFLGLKNFYIRLSDDQRNISIRRVFALVRHNLEKIHNPYDLDFKSPFTTIEGDAAYPALVEIILNTTGPIQAEAKELCFWSIVQLHNRVEKEKLVELIKKKLTGLANLLVSGICEYNRAHPIRMQLQHYFQFNKLVPARGFGGIVAIVFSLFTRGWKQSHAVARVWSLRRAEAKYLELISKQFRKGNATIVLDTDLGQKVSPYFLVLGLNLVPPGTTDASLIKYVRWVLECIFANIDVDQGWGQEKIHFEQLQQAEKALAEILLEQPPDVAISLFDELIDGFLSRKRYSRKLFEFVDRTLKEVMSLCRDNQVTQFWILWERLYEKISAASDKQLLGTVMLDYEYWFSTREDWKPVKGKSEFFKKVVMNENNLVEETAKLLGGLGFPELLPQGLHWLWKQIQEHGIDDDNEFDYTQKLATEVFYDPRLRAMIQSDAELRKSYISILDLLIDNSSPSAYFIREDIISFSAIR